MDAGQAVFAIPLVSYSGRCQADASAGAYPCAKAAAYATILVDIEKRFAPDGEKSREALEDGLTAGAFLVAQDGDVVFLLRDVRHDSPQLFLFFLIDFQLRFHVEGGEPVVDHQDRVDIVEAHAMVEGEFVPIFNDVAGPRAIGNDAEQVRSFQRGFFQESFDHLGRFRLVIGKDQANLVGLEDQVVVFHHLRDTQGRVGELEGGIEAVARGGEIEYQAFLALFRTGRECGYAH